MRQSFWGVVILMRRLSLSALRWSPLRPAPSGVVGLQLGWAAVVRGGGKNPAAFQGDGHETEPFEDRGGGVLAGGGKAKGGVVGPGEAAAGGHDGGVEAQASVGGESHSAAETGHCRA